MINQNTLHNQDMQMEDEQNLLEVRNLKMHFQIKKGLVSRAVGQVKAVDDVSFNIRQGEILGLVGESGCGKSTVGRCIVRAYEVTDGQMRFRNSSGNVVDLAPLKGQQLRPYHKDIRMIFQDPYSSLNPRMTVFQNISEVLRVNKIGTARDWEDRVAYLLRRVGLRPEYMKRYPHAFSGGERQRVVIARALVTNPRLIVADEAVSALDVSVRAQIINLLEELQDEFDLTYLFISHDLSVIRHICDRVVVMYVGKIAEVSEGLDLYVKPRHPYTEALISSVPISNPRQRNKRRRIRLKGQVADPSNPPSGCYFHPRCNYTEEKCATEAPELRPLTQGGHRVACHFAEDLNLAGVIMPDEIE
ncbi:MAG: ATP-binding cassette domain-containing protein [Aggregatilineales bacterium]